MSFNIKILNTSIFLFFPSFIYASGLQTWEQSVISMGVAHADMAAAANNASTAYYNPAGMTRLEDAQISTGVVLADINTKVYDASIVIPNQPSSRVPAFGTDSNQQAYIPNFHGVLPLETEDFGDFYLGISVVGPFGGETLYKDFAINAYAKKTFAQVAIVNPSLAYKLTDKLSLAAGISVQQLKSEYTAQLLLEGTGIKGSSKLSSWKGSWNVGMLYEFTPATRVGVTYHPQVNHDQSGTYKLDIVSPTAKKVIADSDATATLKLPAYTSFGLYHDVNKKLALMTTAVYTQWTSVQALSVDVIENPKLGPEIPLYWRNTWFFGLGSTYQASEKLTFRTGIAYDRTPTIDKTRELHAPDSDRYSFAAGGGYLFYKKLQVDLGYQFLYTPKVKTSNDVISLGGFNSLPQYQSTVRSYVNFVGMQLSWFFD